MSAHLRVLWPENWSPKPRSSPIRKPTLCEFYETYVLPLIRRPRGRSEGTIEQDRVALQHWRRITRDPPIDQITAEVCARFMEQLQKAGMSSSTIRKTAIHLQFILDHAGPPDRRHRNAAKLIDQVPYIERPEGRRGQPEPAFSFTEIETLIDACKQIKETACLSLHDSGLWWASLIRFGWHTGLRRMNLLNARWSWITPDGWLVVPPPSYKQHKDGRRFYLSQAARTVAERVRIPGEDRIFAWNGSLTHFCKQWRSIMSVLPAERWFGTKAIRRATLTWLAERNPLVSRLVAGHRKLDVLEDFYIQREVVIQLLESMPVPKGWDLQ